MGSQAQQASKLQAPLMPFADLNAFSASLHGQASAAWCLQPTYPHHTAEVQLSSCCEAEHAGMLVNQRRSPSKPNQCLLTYEDAAAQTQPEPSADDGGSLLRAVNSQGGCAAAAAGEEGWELVCAKRCHAHALPAAPTPFEKTGAEVKQPVTMSVQVYCHDPQRRIKGGVLKL